MAQLPPFDKEDVKRRMKGAVATLKHEFAGLRTGRANPAILEPVMVEAYGTRVRDILRDAKARADLGPAFGPELTGAEVSYLMTREWARFPDDILWRRSKLGLAMPAGDREALAAFMATVALN